VDGAAAVLANRRVAYFVAFWIGGNPGARLGAFAVMDAYGILLLVGERYEIVKVLRGQPSDKCYQIFDLRATAITGTVMVTIFAFEIVPETIRRYRFFRA
jgi:hypothetical protein